MGLKAQSVKAHVKTKNIADQDFSAFIKNYRDTLQQHLRDEKNIKQISFQRGLPPYILRDVMDCNPLAVYIPEENGGRGGNVAESLSMLETTSYESLPLCLMLGINGALFLQPVSKYADQEVSSPIFRQFLKKKKMGGLMITEPDYGSDALRMQTQYMEQGDGYRIKGVKHWAGLTGWADYWLLTARSSNEAGELSRDIDFFIYDSRIPGLEVEEVYQNLGLYMLPYGRNRIDTVVPRKHRLTPKSTGVTMMLDILHRSRLQFPGMAQGYLRRMLDEAITHCKQRYVGGQSLLNYDQVKSRISKLQTYFTTSSAMCAYTSMNAGIDRDLSKEDIPANAIKSVVTDFMHEASQTLMQLVGAQGYRLDHIAGRSLVDSRPFQIFEGSNDILYQQIAESVLKHMRKLKAINLYEFLSQYELTSRASDYLKSSLNFEVDMKIAQRRMVNLGRALGRIISMDLVIRLGENGFRNDLINNSLETLRSEVEQILTRYQSEKHTGVIEDYMDDGNWFNFLPSLR